MKEKKQFGNWVSSTSQGIVLWIAFLAFAFFTVVGLIQTCHVDIGFSADNSEHVSFLFDNILLNIVVLAVLFVLALLLMKMEVKRRTVVIVAVTLFAVSAAIGVWWVISSKAKSGADSYAILQSAREIMVGDTTTMMSWGYFHKFPFQTGFMLYDELLLRLFGANQLIPLQLVNVLWVVLAEIAMLLLANVLFHDERISLLTAILLGLCFQPMLLSTFLYGTIPGMSLAIWSIYFTARSLRSSKPWLLLPALVLIAVAIMLKKNCFIVLIAEVIAIVLFVFRTKKHLMLVIAAAMIAASLALPAFSQAHYEKRANTSFGKGTPQLAWAVTGLRDSMFCAGWFNGYTNYILFENDFDYEKTLAQNKADLMERIATFSQRPVYLASFMYHKIVSQWNEPAFQSIWSSASDSRTGEVSDFVISLGTGEASNVVNAYFNQLMQFVYAGFTVSLLFLLRKKEERGEDRIIIPLILVGAVLYHAVFEAKAQYAIIYVPMILPYAAYGLKKLSENIRIGGKKESAQSADINS